MIDNVATITVADTPIEAQVVKTDLKGNPLANGTFTLAPAAGSSFTDAYPAQAIAIESDANGVAQIPAAALIAGNTYELMETVSPAGYEVLGALTFTVNADGTLTFVDLVPAGYALSVENGVATITAADTPVEAQLVKHDENGEPLAGATFTIVPNEGSAFAGKYSSAKAIAIESGAGGVAPIPSTSLIVGNTYTISETVAPSGYELAGSVAFTVNADGIIEAQDSAMAGHVGWITPGYAVSEDGLMLVAVDRPIPPVNPDDPDELEDPDEPTDPTDPEEPADPDDPAKPADPAKPTQPADKDKLPQSGDASWPVAYVSASGAVLVIAGIALETWRRRSKLEH